MAGVDQAIIPRRSIGPGATTPLQHRPPFASCRQFIPPVEFSTRPVRLKNERNARRRRRPGGIEDAAVKARFVQHRFQTGATDGIGDTEGARVQHRVQTRATNVWPLLLVRRYAPTPASRRVSGKVSTLVDARTPTAAAPSDAQLVTRSRAGEPRAFDLLVLRYQRRAASVAYRLLGDLHDAMEVCQEAFIRAFQRLDTLENPERFRPWLLRIVTNLSLNSRRARAAARRRVSFDDCLLNPESPSGRRLNEVRSAAYRPEVHAFATELAAALRQALARLTRQQRAALVLFSIEQLPQREVAIIMGCSVEAVKWHVFQARKKLRTMLAEYI